MENKNLRPDELNSVIRIINNSPPIENQKIDIKNTDHAQKQTPNDAESVRSVTSPIFLKVIKAITNNKNNRKDGSTCSTLSTRVSLDFNNQDDENKVYVTKKKEFDFDEYREDAIYKPCELDFNIAAQLIKDAIYGTDIDFKQNKISLL
jgi:hypothetical protein